MKELILNLKKLLATVTFDDAKKKEVEAQIAALESAEAAAAAAAGKPAKVKDGEPAKMELPPEVISAMNEINTVKEMLVKQQERADKAEKAMQEKLKDDHNKKVTDYKKSVTEGDKRKLTPAELKEKYEPLLDNPETFNIAMKIIDALPVHPSAKQPLQKVNGNDPASQNQTVEKAKGPLGSVNTSILGKVMEFSNQN